MLTLVRHIKTLLLTHEHVALPQFGTFFTEAQPTSCDAMDVFMPTQRTLHFTAEIDDTDTLLLESYRTTYRLTPERARQRLDREIAEAGKILASTGTLDFDTLGMFTLCGGRIAFETCKATLVVPEMYGLDAFTVPSLPSLGTERAKRHESQNDAYVIRLNRNLVHTVASVAAAIILFFLISTPLNSPTADSHICSIIPAVAPSSKEYTPVQTESKDNEESTDVSNVVNEQDTMQSEEKTNELSSEREQPEGNLTIVLATGVSQRNAEAFIDQLERAGIEGAEIHISRRLRRVIYKRFTSERDAYNAIRTIQAKSSDVSEAWVMKLPTE